MFRLDSLPQGNETSQLFSYTDCHRVQHLSNIDVRSSILSVPVVLSWQQFHLSCFLQPHCVKIEPGEPGESKPNLRRRMGSFVAKQEPGQAPHPRMKNSWTNDIYRNTQTLFSIYKLQVIIAVKQCTLINNKNILLLYTITLQCVKPFIKCFV